MIISLQLEVRCGHADLVAGRGEVPATPLWPTRAPGPDSDRSEVFMGDILLKILFAATGPEVRSCELSELIQCFYEVFLRSEVADCEHVSPHALPEPVQANLR